MDTLLIDSDSEFHSDIWALLDSPPLKPYHIIGLSENPLNGGTMFVRCVGAVPVVRACRAAELGAAHSARSLSADAAPL